MALALISNSLSVSDGRSLRSGILPLFTHVVALALWWCCGVGFWGEKTTEVEQLHLQQGVSVAHHKARKA